MTKRAYQGLEPIVELIVQYIDADLVAENEALKKRIKTYRQHTKGLWVCEVCNVRTCWGSNICGPHKCGCCGKVYCGSCNSYISCVAGKVLCKPCALRKEKEEIK